MEMEKSTEDKNSGPFQSCYIQAWFYVVCKWHLVALWIMDGKGPWVKVERPTKKFFSILLLCLLCPFLDALLFPCLSSLLFLSHPSLLLPFPSVSFSLIPFLFLYILSFTCISLPLPSLLEQFCAQVIKWSQVRYVSETGGSEHEPW